MILQATAETEVTVALAVVKTLVLLVGSVITYFAFKAYRRTQQRALGLLALGFGIVTLGFVLAGVLHQLLQVDLATGILLESLLVLIGFAIIAYSLYAQ
ncbi:DUF7521 family protein [Natrononativus amylolyticus]|uniref:DUF7521 family protein n=1 Tax=Natrononativus amylolyticus TaxID=2963434 RepID=UPI0020CD6EEA|nr:hypothetical protein [Natrononativus amylolyticus]